MPHNSAPAEYTRKIVVAAGIAAGAWVRGGLDAMQDELSSLRRIEADPLIVAEVDRLYHQQCLRSLPPSV